MVIVDYSIALRIKLDFYFFQDILTLINKERGKLWNLPLIDNHN
jgi:hypothetical protein